MDDGRAELIRSLEAAVSAAPGDVPLRLHLAELLAGAGDGAAATRHAATALQHDPDSPAARALMARLLGGTEPAAEPPAPSPAGQGFDWKAADAQFRQSVPPVFAEGSGDAPDGGEGDGQGAGPDETGTSTAPPVVRLADVAGMQHVKDRLEAAFLAPMRDPRLRTLFRKSLRGGLLLYGPPGCGKTFIARALAGEMGASFVSVGLADILDRWLGNAEKNVRAIFDTARRQQPCVVFLDEVDAVGMKRMTLHGSGMRNTVTQLLTELDSVGSSNEGVFVLAATNHPWDVDSALRRPGRLDRMLLVLPPDAPAREALLRAQFADRPAAGIDLSRLVKATDGFSGADLAHLCESAAEAALLESIRSPDIQLIRMRHLEHALREVRPSTGAWFEAARNVALFANESGTYDDLLAYLKRRGMV